MSAAGPAGPETITIVVAGERPIVRAGLRRLLEAEADMTVVGETDGADAARREVARLRPTVLVIDPGAGDGVVATISPLAVEAPQTGIVVLGSEPGPEAAPDVLRAGVQAYVPRDAGVEALLEAVRAAGAGGMARADQVSPSRPGTTAPAAAGGLPDRLSAREVEVLRLLASGHTNAEIAARLYLSVRTVESHRAHIQQKTGRTSRAALVAYASERHLL